MNIKQIYISIFLNFNYNEKREEPQYLFKENKKK